MVSNVLELEKPIVKTIDREKFELECKHLRKILLRQIRLPENQQASLTKNLNRMLQFVLLREALHCCEQRPKTSLRETLEEVIKEISDPNCPSAATVTAKEMLLTFCRFLKEEEMPVLRLEQTL